MISYLRGSRPRLRSISPLLLSAPSSLVSVQQQSLDFLPGSSELPSLIKYKGAVPGPLVALSAHSLLIGTIVITIFSLLVFGGLTYVAFILYPGLEAGNRQQEY